jgi:hypothetical protein
MKRTGIAIGCSALSGFAVLLQLVTAILLSSIKKMESIHASCLGHFHAYQTTSKANTTCAVDQTIA